MIFFRHPIIYQALTLGEEIAEQGEGGFQSVEPSIVRREYRPLSVPVSVPDEISDQGEHGFYSPILPMVRNVFTAGIVAAPPVTVEEVVEDVFPGVVQIIRRPGLPVVPSVAIPDEIADQGEHGFYSPPPPIVFPFPPIYVQATTPLEVIAAPGDNAFYSPAPQVVRWSLVFYSGAVGYGYLETGIDIRKFIIPAYLRVNA